MAFPTITEIVNSRKTTPGTSHVVDLPTLAAPGDVMLVVSFCAGNAVLGGWPPGFVPLFDRSANISQSVWYFVFLPALLPVLGVERPRPALPGGQITLTTPVSRRSDVYACLFAEKFPLSYILYAGPNVGPGFSPDPPNLTYSASAKDVLWLVTANGIGYQGPAGYPTNYNLYQGFFYFTGGGGGPTEPGWGAGMAGRELNATSEDPSIFTGIPASSDHEAFTIGIALDGP